MNDGRAIEMMGKTFRIVTEAGIIPISDIVDLHGNAN
uniref:Uncharacterized protein n=1 Tax=Candidatus Kentrum sp. TC TaxID=2126339 RepID=A0A451A4N5_9GAMM|nr:MAG: hypothetical protein BECKTC1821E_GA0114239_10449 [Candidatus Kentron sp. TC]VFK49163.1 MAG: hypothetical protein BECKTC1821D_GA0114238_107016 [Candidatus Kentron sp. TC]VFK61000.1 MAG: hypothetical protein BECKTC1821F_GA0114240_10528 [Candidatus Kentron sp. TC]